MNTSNFSSNIAAFARLLRSAGLPVGPGATLDAIQALHHVGLARRDVVFGALQAVFVRRHEDAPIFREAFDLFFASRSPEQVLEAPAGAKDEEDTKISRRLQEAMQALMPRTREQEVQTREERVSLSVSEQEVLQKKDFAQMSAAERQEAVRAIQSFMLYLSPVRSRRLMPSHLGARLDLRRTLRTARRGGGEVTDLRYLGQSRRLPPVVALLDISGSMSDYTRIFLHFMHALGERHRRVASFLFGTRLTNVTRDLRARDPDEAVDACVGHVADWSGGTRIAPSIRDFNRLWGRRVLGQGAVVLLITDGLERAADDALAFEMDRLRRSCRRLVWLNPLLRYEGFEPKASGIRTMLPHVDEFLPVHNLQSLSELARLLADMPARRGAPTGVRPWRDMADAGADQGDKHAVAR